MKLDHLKFPDYGWGYMPATEEMYDVFRYCEERYHPTSVLEIGFHLGHSTTYQLEIYKSAKIVSVSPYNDNINSADKIDPADRHKMAIKLAELYPGRWSWIPGKTHNVEDEIKSFSYDFALVDGNHSYGHAFYDIGMCIRLGIKQFLIDNFDQRDVKRAFFDTPNLVPIKVFDYHQTFKGKTKSNQIALVEIDNR